MSTETTKQYFKNKKIILTDCEVAIVEILKKKHKLSNSRILIHIKRFKEDLNNTIDESFINIFEQILNLGRDSSSYKSLLIRYGKTLGNIKFKEKNDKCSNKGAKRHGVGSSLENYINRHGIELGTKLWNQYKEKRRQTYNKRKLEGKYLHMNTKDSYISLYGKIEGTKRWKEVIEHRRYKKTKEYVYKTHGLIKGKQILQHRHDNVSLSSYQHRLGEEKGLMEYNKHIVKLKHSVRKKLNTFPKKTKSIKTKTNHCSKISKNLFDEIVKYTDIDKSETFYGDYALKIQLTKTQYNKINKRFIQVDFSYKNKIIEFYGDYWHGNLDIYENHDLIKGKTVKSKRLEDEQRIEFIKSLGYEVMIIWENDYKRNPSLVIEDIIKFLEINQIGDNNDNN